MIQCPNQGRVGSTKMWAELALFVPVQFQMRLLSKIYDCQRKVKFPKTVHFFNARKLNSSKGQRFWPALGKFSRMYSLFSAFKGFWRRKVFMDDLFSPKGTSLEGRRGTDVCVDKAQRCPHLSTPQ